MITRGSKYFYGAAAVAYLMALLYGFVTEAGSHGGVAEIFRNGPLMDTIVGPLSFGWKGGVGDQVGYTLLMGFAGVMAVLGGFSSAFRDGSAEALAELQGGRVDRSAGVVEGADLRIAAPSGLSYWPVLAAFSLGAMVVGAAVSTPLLLIGLIGLLVAGVEWTVRAWSERATGDPERNREVRNRFMYPIEIPVGATLVIGVVVYSMSRVLLAVPAIVAVFLIIILASAIFATAVLLANRPHLKRSVLVVVLLVGGLAIIGGGIAGGIAGPREHSAAGAVQQATLPVQAAAGLRAPGGSIEPVGSSVGD